MSQGMQEYIDRLRNFGTLSGEQFVSLLRYRNPEITGYLYHEATEVSMRYFQKGIFLWGRIPFSDYCKNDCKYCGMRRSNRFVHRYRLSREEILGCCHKAYEQGVRHFLLEGGVDIAFDKEQLSGIVHAIRKHFPKAQVHIEMGERPRDLYEQLRREGAQSAIMPEVTADESHFRSLHPGNLSLLRRKQCMWEIKEIGYDTGAGFLVGTPGQTIEQVAENLLFLKQYGPNILQIQPFLPALHTPYEKERSGNGEMVLYVMAILRLMFPAAVIIADTSLEQTMHNGRLQALQAGANVIIQDLPLPAGKGPYTVYQSRNRNPEDQLQWLVEQIENEGYDIQSS